jgi:glycosyltransferase involved in cell wall biosynthesis
MPHSIERCEIVSSSVATQYGISVVLPVYSETESVRTIVEWLATHLGPRLLEVIIVLAPASTEQSRLVCQDLADRDGRVRIHIQQCNPGLGHAVREGIAKTRGSHVLLMDSDGEMENDTIMGLLGQMIEGNYGLVVASRWARGGGFIGYSRAKLVCNWCFQQLFRLLYWTNTHDLTYGFKLLSGELARSIEWQGTFHEIACETTLRPIKLGASVAEVPSRWTARRQGSSKNSIVGNLRYLWMAVHVLFGRTHVHVAVVPTDGNEHELFAGLSSERHATRCGDSSSLRRVPFRER